MVFSVLDQIVFVAFQLESDLNYMQILALYIFQTWKLVLNIKFPLPIW
jgi:hypothetical protein